MAPFLSARPVVRIGRPPAGSALLAGFATLAVATLVALVIGLAGAAAGGADDRFTAGSRLSAPVAATAAELAPAIERAAAVGRALGFPEGRRTAVRVRDRFADRVLDEVTTLDRAGRPLLIERFDARSRLVLAVRLGWSSAQGHLSAAGARDRAAAFLDAVGIAPSGAGRPSADGAGHGWVVRWSREVAGVPVTGDGVVVRLWADGSVHSISATESALAAVPRQPIDEAAARRLATAVVGSWSTTEPTGRVAAVRLAWVAPNDLFDPSGPDAPVAVRRLAWVADVTPVGPLAARLRSVQIYIDAADGRLLGGDLLE